MGRGLVPDVERISARFHERRTKRTPFERVLLRITGMDLNLSRSTAGVAGVARRVAAGVASSRVATGYTA